MISLAEICEHTEVQCKVSVQRYLYFYQFFCFSVSINSGGSADNRCQLTPAVSQFTVLVSIQNSAHLTLAKQVCPKEALNK